MLICHKFQQHMMISSTLFPFLIVPHLCLVTQKLTHFSHCCLVPLQASDEQLYQIHLQNKLLSFQAASTQVHLQHLEDAACCMRANLTPSKAQGPFATHAHLPTLHHSFCLQAGLDSERETLRTPPHAARGEEVTTPRDAATPHEHSQLFVPARKPCCLQLVKYHLQSILLNTLTPREAQYHQPGFRASPELMDSTPLSKLAEISHKVASVSCLIFHRAILLQHHQQHQWS